MQLENYKSGLTLPNLKSDKDKNKDNDSNKPGTILLMSLYEKTTYFNFNCNINYNFYGKKHVK